VASFPARPVTTGEHRARREEGETDISRREDPGGASEPADGTEPDARFTFANERTFLAWSRTALALVAAGLAIVQLLPPFPGIPWGRHIIGTPLILLGSVVAIVSYLDWTGNQRALRTGKPVIRSRLPLILAVTVAIIGLAAAALALLSAVTSR
jgi:putative membrane protein